jgi:hypothetical protein
MAAGDQIVIGDVVQIGYGELTRTGYVIQSANQSRTADVATAKDERNATICHVISNPGIAQSLTMLIRDTGTITPPIVGSLISLKRPDDQYATKYILASPATVAHQVDFTTLTISVIRESSMEATYNTSAALSSSAEDYDVVVQDPVAVTVTLNDTSAIISIVDSDDTTLTPTTHYTFALGTLTITAAYLETVIDDPGDDITLTINFNVGNPASLVITGAIAP